MKQPKKQVPLFECAEPCGNCPYRTDAPTQFWAKEEFKDLLLHDGTAFGTVYKCHKNNGSVCVGWLMNQRDNGLHSITLRMALIRHSKEIAPDYLDSLTCPVPMFESVKEMVEANFPEILTEEFV